MTSFLALNIEPEEDSDNEVDDSKEIQIEEALKLYQNALKLHSQGPDFYDEAEIAYQTLFQSEIFTYLESLSESRRFQVYGASDVFETGSGHPSPSESVAATAGVDGAPSTLPQILYLSYKNHGQFILDRLRYQIFRSQQIHGSDKLQSPEDVEAISKVVSSSLGFFTEALDRDDTDLELWRQVSKLSSYLGSRRIERFCLEAVLDDDGESPVEWREPLGLEESFAMEQLKVLVQSLQDHVSDDQASVHSDKQPNISKSLKRFFDPCPYLPVPLFNPSTKALGYTVLNSVAINREISVPLRTWASCGKAILAELGKIAQDVVDPEPGVNYNVVLPARLSTDAERIMIGPRTDVSVPISRRAMGYSRTTRTGNDEGLEVSQGTATLEYTNEELLSPVNQDSNKVLTGTTPSLSMAHEAHALGQAPSSSGTHERKGLDSANDIVLDNGNNDDQTGTQSKTGSNGNTISLPTRKRSSEVAGMQEPVDVGRSRSKRIKARVSVAEPNNQELPQEDLIQYYEEQLRNYTQADHWMFERAGAFLFKLNAQSLGSLAELKRTISMARSNDVSYHLNSPDRSSDVVARDLRGLICSWDMTASNLFLQRASLDESIGGADGERDSSLTVFLEHSKRGLQHPSHKPSLSSDNGLEEFTNDVNSTWTSLDQVSLMWIEKLLCAKPENHKRDGGFDNSGSAYTTFLWPDTLKETVEQILVKQDEPIYTALFNRVQDTGEHLLSTENGASTSSIKTVDSTVVSVIQSIFELHLDIYGQITKPSSEVDLATRTLQLDRLCRWAELASFAYSKRPISDPCTTLPDLLSIRFMWSSVIYTNLVDPSSRDHVLLCFQDLRQVLEGLDSPVIELPNNAIIPEISVEAVEKEISWLTTMDFFLNIFSPGKNDPLAIIESLEPMLERALKQQKSKLRGHSMLSENSTESGLSNPDSTPSNQDYSQLPKNKSEENMDQMLQFLDKASINLKLFLWRKLGRAYEAIQYRPRTVSCDLRCIELIMDYLLSAAYADSTEETRRISLPRWLRILDDLIGRVLTFALSDSVAFDCVDEDHLQRSVEALATIQRILHVFALWEDSVRISQTLPPAQVNAAAVTAYGLSKHRFRNMIVRTWTLQYLLLKEAVAQTPKLFETPNDDLADYLKIVHHAFGLRYYCKESNKIFLKLMKAELLRLQPQASWDTDVGQVLFDLYGLKVCPTYMGSQDHGCPPELFGRQTAIEIMDIVMIQANRMNVKDLLKSELKFTIEKMHNALKGRRETILTKFNRHIFNKYLRSPINPVFLYRALRGIGDLSGTSVKNEDSIIAEKGWYFLQGHIALAKYRSQKRTSQGPVDDLDNASAFFRQDLEFNMEKWETWYRLGQVYDAKIEEDTTWNAEKLNNHIEDLNMLQRSAIHCYAMAIAVAKRSADASFETISKISELYADFGTRIYSSSREPFSMGAFSLENFAKHFNGAKMGMYKKRPFRDLRLYPAWKFASELFRRALIHKPQDWVLWYLQGKCLWKMHDCDDHIRGNAQRISYSLALDSFRKAIDVLPERRDSRHPEKDPTLEPHYKLVSIVHKLVQTRRLQPDDGCRYLAATTYARKVPAVQDLEDWEGYMIQVLKTLRSADKANWHHRMVARAAHILYDDSPGELQSALGAKHELTQQIFTKTMAIQVWKPENERPGRHFVYTSQYVSFFVRLSFQLNDRASLEVLAKRMRKRSGDFFHHAQIWSEVCKTYLELLRRASSVPEEYHETIFKLLPYDHFTLNADRLESWAHSSSTTSPTLGLLREVVELKRLNGTLIKPTPIEDLISDTYAQLYHSTVPDLIAKSNDEESKARMRVNHLLMNIDDPSTDTPLPVNRPGDPTPKPRTKGVSKREILKRAEALLLKPSAPPSTTTKTPSISQPSAQKPEQDLPPSLATLAVKEDIVGRDIASSVPGSLHDSADDESELSEIEEVLEAPKPLFPGLVGSVARAEEIEDSEREGGREGKEEEGEGEGEGEGEEGEEGEEELEGEGEGEGGEEGAE